MSLKYGILGLLHQSPMTGYNLKKLFDKTLNNVWTASLSQIYRELGVLQKDGYVLSHMEEQDDRPDKRVYRISEEGTQAFRAWLSCMPDTFLSPKRDEFTLKLFFGSVMGKEEVKRQMEAFLADRLRAMHSLDEDIGRMHELYTAYRGQDAMDGEEERYIRFIVDRAQRTNRLLVRWAQDCIDNLGEADGQQKNKGEGQP